MHGKNRMNKNSKLSMRWNNAQSSHYVKITFWQQAHAFYAIFFSSLQKLRTTQPIQIRFIAFKFPSQSNIEFKGMDLSLFLQNVRVFFFQEMNGKKNISPLLSSDCNVLSSWNPILPYCQRENRAFFGFKRRHLNSNIKCEYKNTYPIFHLW